MLAVCVLCWVAETFGMATGQDSAILRVGSRMKMVTDKQMSNAASYQRRRLKIELETP